VRLAEELMDGWAPLLEGVELKTGSKGRFEVLIDGQEVFSKARLNRFPAEGEIAKVLGARLGPPPQWRSSHK
jgi:selT/selW/selH-like putative selenoprotein